MAADPEDKLFWQQVREAVDQVSTHYNRELTVGVGYKNAEVFMSDGTIVIEITEREPVQPTLIVPPGGGDKD